MTISTKNNLQIAPVKTPELDLERFKPYQYRPPATFAIILENFLKLIANQFIQLGNFLDKTFCHIENPRPIEKSTEFVAKRVLSPPEPLPILPNSVNPAVKPKKKPTCEAPKALTNQDYLQRYLNDLPGLERTDLSHKIRPLNPHALMLPSVWDKIFNSICQRVWVKLPDPKELEPTDQFKNEMKLLILNSFTEDKYRFFEDYYLTKHSDLKDELSQLNQQAKMSGAVSAVAVAGLNYFAGDLLSPNQLAEFITNETGLTHLSSAAYLLLWGLAIVHLTQKMGVKKPSLEDMKNFFRDAFSMNPAVLLDNIYRGCTLKQLKTITHTTVASLCDKIYKSCTQENLIRLGFVAGSLCFERYVNCIRHVTTAGVNFLIKKQLLPKHVLTNQEEEKTEYFTCKQREFSSALTTKISLTQLGWKGLELTGSIAYQAASMSKNAFSSLGSFLA
jgi:hypothetical protein